MMNRRHLSAVVAAFLTVVLSGAASGNATDEDRSARLLSHPLTAADGSETTLAALAGQVLVVNFWATWCAPCRSELARLDEWNAEWAPRGARVVAVSLDRERARALRFAQDADLTLTVLHDGPEGLARDLDLPAVPTSFILDRDGRIVLVVRGSGERELANMRTAVEGLLANPGERAGS